MVNIQQVLAAVVNRRFGGKDNHNNKISKWKKRKGNCSHESNAFSHHPFQITHENHSNSQHGLFQNAIRYCYVIHCLETRQVMGE